MNKVQSLLSLINSIGMMNFIKESYYRLIDSLHEIYFSVNTKGSVTTFELGIDDVGSKGYAPISYLHTTRMLRRLPIKSNDITLLDLGCGKGRVLVIAASFSYKKIIGVELSHLIYVAKENVCRMRHRKTKVLKTVHCDAAKFLVPIDVNVVYFYNPFEGLVLEKVVENIYSSYMESPRKIYIIFFNNVHFEKAVCRSNWLKKTYQGRFYPNISCGLYETIFQSCE